MTVPKDPLQSETTEVYVIVGSSGDYSTLQVWVAGVYDDKNTAVREAENMKSLDRANWVLWKAWNSDFNDRHRKIGKKWNYATRAADILELGMTAEPPIGGDDTDYTVACVPMNTLGRWNYA